MIRPDRVETLALSTRHPAPHGPHLVEITADQDSSATLPPGGPRLVEIEDDTGRSIAIGKWLDRGDGFWALRIACHVAEPTE